MTTAHFTFHGDLINFLSPSWRLKVAQYSFHPHQTVKHLIEAAGIPHTEVCAIVSNGESVGSDYHAQENDQIDIYPYDAQHVRTKGDSVPVQFLLDNHLGKLARILRMLGLDCLYDNNFQDDRLAELALQTGRVLLTRDRRLLMRNSVSKGYCLRSTSPSSQVVEVLRRYQLASQVRPFTRCMNCNEPLQPVKKDDVMERLQPLTKKYFDYFNICPGCEQIYWPGSHHQRMNKLIPQLIAEVNDTSAIIIRRKND
jgi:hypothetical protein